MLQDVIMAYKQDHGTPELSPVEAANAYNDMEHSPGEVLDSYKVLTRYLVAQYNDLRSIGFRFTYVSGEPYRTSKAMFVDALHGVLTVRKSLGEDYNDLPDNHPMSIRVETVDGLMVANDVFRAVHDILGHFAIRATIAPEGECLAWLHHRSLLPRTAHLALWCETRGQNTWTNYYSDHSLLPVRERPYAQQKCGTVSNRLI